MAKAKMHKMPGGHMMSNTKMKKMGKGMAGGGRVGLGAGSKKAAPPSVPKRGGRAKGQEQIPYSSTIKDVRVEGRPKTRRRPNIKDVIVRGKRKTTGTVF